MIVFEIFKGRKNKKGRVIPIRNVGCGYYCEDSDLCELHINGLENDGYTLEPEKDVNANHDYVIYYENLDSEDLQRVGVGYLLDGRNAGLLRLEWDLFDNRNMYLSLSKNKMDKALRMAA